MQNNYTPKNQILARVKRQAILIRLITLITLAINPLVKTQSNKRLISSALCWLTVHTGAGSLYACQSCAGEK